MRLFVEKGYLIQPQEIEHGGETYVLPLEFQVFDESGDPATGSYKGEGSITHDNRIIFGDPYRDTTLTEGKVARQATSESWDYYQGFKAALEDRREAREGRGDMGPKPKLWWDGYRQAWREKRERKMKKNGASERERFADLQRQGFMKPRRAAKAKQEELPIVACDACQNWHREGKHTADAATRRANLKMVKERGY